MSGTAPPKPWERAGAATIASAEGGPPKPWERPSAGGTVVPTSLTAGPASVPSTALAQRNARPWDRGGTGTTSSLPSTSYGGATTPYSGATVPYGTTGAYGSNTGAYGITNYGSNTGYGGYGSGGYGSGGAYGSGMYNRPFGSGAYGSGMYGGSMYGAGSSYGGGMYGNSMYGGGGGMYGRQPMYGSGMYGGAGGGGMYGPGAMVPGGGMYGGPQDPHGPPAPPSTWAAMLAAVGGVVHFFGRLSFLVDENAHAVHFFVSALLQLLDRFGSLYGELARFVLRVLGYKGRKGRGEAGPGGAGPPAGSVPPMASGPADAPAGAGHHQQAFDGLWPGGR